MATFTKNKQTDQFDIIGLESEFTRPTVTVLLRDGTKKTVTVGRVSKAFTAKFGPLAGKKCCIATVSGGGSSGGRVYDNATERRSNGVYCGYPCPVTDKKCCPANGKCHDCQ